MASLNELQQNIQQSLALVQAKNAEAEAIRNEISSAKESLVRLEQRLDELVGKKEEQEEEQRIRPTLKQIVGEILEQANEPLTVREVAELVQEKGYTTSSKHFLNIVQQVLSGNDFRRVTRPKTRPSRYTIK